MTDEEKAAAAAAAKAAEAADAEKTKTAQEAADKVAADKVAADKVAADKVAADKAAANGEDDKTAALQAKIDALQAKIDALEAAAAKFDGLDPEAARAAITANSAAEAARLSAEKDKAKAEGNFEKLREIQQAETEAAIKAAQDGKEAAEKDASDARSELSRARIETAFANSKYLQDETILSGPKAQRLFSDHVEVEDGQVVVYDAPAGTAKRAKVMDSKGNALSFNDAIAKVIEADIDKDTLLKSKMSPGTGSKTIDGKVTAPAVSRHEKMKAGLKAIRR